MSTDLTLYQLSNERRELQSKLELLNLDEITILDTLEGESTNIAEKIEDYGWVIKNFESFEKQLNDEEFRLSERRKMIHKKIERIKEQLFTGMVNGRIDKVECPVFTISIASNPPSVIIDSEVLIPNEFWTVPDLPVPVPNKAAIKAAIKAGNEVPGCHMESSKRLQMR